MNKKLVIAFVFVVVLFFVSAFSGCIGYRTVLEVDGDSILSHQLERYIDNHHLWGQIFVYPGDFNEVSFKLCKYTNTGTIKLYVTETTLNADSQPIPDMENILATGEIDVNDVNNEYGTNEWEFNPFVLSETVTGQGSMAIILEYNGPDFIYINHQESDIYPDGYEVVQGDDLYSGIWHAYDNVNMDFYFRLRV